VKDRQLTALVFFLAAAIMAVLIFPTSGERVYFPSDLGEQNLPLRALYAQALASGDSISWSPAMFGGFAMHGEGQGGLLHPWHYLIYRTLPLHLAFNLELLLPYPLMLLGLFLLLRRWELGSGPAAVGALLFSFSGFNLMHIIHLNAIQIIAHLPWILLAIDVALRSPDPRRVAFARLSITLLTASQLLLGYPQYVWFSTLVELGYILLRGPGSLRGLLTLGLAKALGVLGGCAQLLPTAEAAALSTRAGPSLEFASSFALHPFNLIQLVAPYLMKERVYGLYAHEYGLYNGAVTITLLAWLVVRRKTLGPQRRLAIGALILGTLGLITALGRHGGLYQLLARLPLVGLFRAPSRYILLVHLAMSVGAAIALADLARSSERPALRSCWPLFALLLAGLGAALVAFLPRAAQRIAGPLEVLAGPALLLLACILVLAAASGRRGALIGLVLLGSLDLAAYGISYLWRYPPTRSIPVFADSVSQPPTPTDSPVLGARNPLVLKGYRLADGYAGLIPKRRLDLRQPRARRVAGIGWVLTQGTWIRQTDPLPRVRLVSRSEQGSDLSRIDVATTALVPVPLELDGRPGSARLTVDRPGRLDVAVDTPGRQLLVISERYHLDWQATIGGKPVPILPVYGDYLACVVPAGASLVQLRFQSASLRRGGWLSAIGLLLALAWFIGALWVDRGTARPGASAPARTAA